MLTILYKNKTVFFDYFHSFYDMFINCYDKSVTNKTSSFFTVPFLQFLFCINNTYSLYVLCIIIPLSCILFIFSIYLSQIDSGFYFGYLKKNFKKLFYLFSPISLSPNLSNFIIRCFVASIILDFIIPSKIPNPF